MKTINIGLIGFGTIGSGVVKVLTERRDSLKHMSGVDINLKYVCDKNLSASRGIKVKKGLLTKDADTVLNDPDVDIVIELIGGIHPAREFILKALKNGKHVVTANKALLAQSAHEIFRAAAASNREVRFEASVGGGIPIIKALHEGFVANRINEIYGIINGTCNYILSRMSDEGCDFDAALKEAQRMGVAEANPTLDINGSDSAHKIKILAALSFGRLPKDEEVYQEGILAIEPCDIRYAKDMGYTIKLIAIAKRTKEGIEVRVHPTLVPDRHIFANVKGVFNAIYLKGDLIGDMLFYGKGAGSLPTASAVVSDVVDLAKLVKNNKTHRWLPVFKDVGANGHSPLQIKKIDLVQSKYYIRIYALDKPGVLARVSGILGKNGISIASVTQKEERIASAAPVVMMTHEAVESRMRRALEAIDKLPVIKKKSIAIRVETL